MVSQDGEPKKAKKQEQEIKMKKTSINKKPMRVALLLASIVSLAPLFSTSAMAQTRIHRQPADIAALYQLYAAFHGAASCAGLDRDQHIQDMLALWTEDGVLIAGSTTYQGRGVWNGSSCTPSGPTLCDFFANHAGSFVSGRAWVGLSPSYKTAIDVLGDTATLFFECHYFDVSTTPPQWRSDASYGVPGQPLTGLARKVNGKWLLSYAVAAAPPLSCN
jgi:hypothetical protein